MSQLIFTKHNSPKNSPCYNDITLLILTLTPHQGLQRGYEFLGTGCQELWGVWLPRWTPLILTPGCCGLTVVGALDFAGDTVCAGCTTHSANGLWWDVRMDKYLYASVYFLITLMLFLKALLFGNKVLPLLDFLIFAVIPLPDWILFLISTMV